MNRSLIVTSLFEVVAGWVVFCIDKSVAEKIVACISSEGVFGLLISSRLHLVAITINEEKRLVHSSFLPSDHYASTRT